MWEERSSVTDTISYETYSASKKNVLSAPDILFMAFKD
jgi:hypothetical protein